MKKAKDIYIKLLSDLISTPSPSGREDKSARLLLDFLHAHEIKTERHKNNIIAKNEHFSGQKPTILLNSHHDTVAPNTSWTKDPFTPVVVQKKLYGLGSNDAGASLVALIATFKHFYRHTDLPYNLILALTAEEENSGKYGIASLLPHLGPIDFAIVGEPTKMKMAVAEKGLMVLDCTVRGTAGHAARSEGKNAIYVAMADIDWFQNHQFSKASTVLGPVKMTVTMINAGTQHNVVPDECRFVVDVRSTDTYTNTELLQIIRDHVHCEVTPRSTRLEPSGLPEKHILKDCAELLGIDMFGSPTLSDQALMPFPSVKIGPGDSARSHTADEFIGLEEIDEGIDGYGRLLHQILNIRK
jgi:acetylornithine deacetylase